MQVRARLISMGNGKKTAEVVSYIGEGSQKRSVTSHIRLGKDGCWTAPNPDRAAVAKLNAAEKVAAEADKNIAPLVRAVSNLEVEIYLLKDTRSDAKAAGMDDEATERAYQKARRDLGKQLREAVAARDAKLPIWQVAQKAADAVRAEVPRYPEFVF